MQYTVTKLWLYSSVEKKSRHLYHTINTWAPVHSGDSVFRMGVSWDAVFIKLE